MAKAKRYNGEEDGSFVEAGSGTADSEASADTGAKPTTFKEAFASARKAGDKTFEFGGKKFTTELASEKKPAAKAPAAEPEKAKPRYQSLADRARDYESARAKSGVSMYGSTKREREERSALPLKSTKSESGYSGMGAMKFSKGGATASKRADGIATKGKTRGKMY